MGLGEAVKTVLFKKYATFSGRASRSEFWWFKLAVLIVTLSLSFGFGFVVTFFLIDEVYIIKNWYLVLNSLSVILLIPELAVFSRRLHDLNFSGRWLIAPAYISIFFILSDFYEFFTYSDLAVTGNYTVYDLVMMSKYTVVYSVFWVSLGLASIINFFLHIRMISKGTTGTNRFGQDPLRDQYDADIFD